MKKLLLIFLLAVPSLGQIPDYSPHPKDKPAAVKFHLALNVVKKHTPLERELLLEAIDNPAKSQEGAINQVFGKNANIFYQIGTEDISDLKRVYNLPDKGAKTDLIKDWTPHRKADLWRQNFALAISRGLNRQQELYLLELSDALPLTKESAGAWEQKALALFTKDVGREIFAMIGHADCGQKIAGKFVFGDCVCTTNSGNWSCTNSCSGGGSCSVKAASCGFLWLWDCNGSCDLGEEVIQ